MRKCPWGAGGLHDRDTSLVHFGFREYDIYTGKWTAKDPIDFSGGDSNFYGYVLGNPVNFVDPKGLWVAEILVGAPLVLSGIEWYDGMNTMKDAGEKARVCSELFLQIDFTLKNSRNSCMSDSERNEFESRLLRYKAELRNWCNMNVGNTPFE